MKTIAVATDFSEISINAARYAADLACWLKTELHLLHVSPLPVIINEIALPFPSEEKNAGEELELMAKELTERTGGKIIIRTNAVEGTVSTQLERYCKEHDTDILVMGSESRQGLNLFFSAATFDAIRLLQVPLLIIPRETHFSPVKTIGFACDLSHAVPVTLLQKIRTVAGDFGAQLYVVHVNNKHSGFTGREMEEAMNIRTHLGRLWPIYDFLEGEDAGKVVAKEAIDKQWDLLIAIHRNHGLIGNLLHHSQSKELAIHTHTPLLIIHE